MSPSSSSCCPSFLKLNCGLELFLLLGMDLDQLEYYYSARKVSFLVQVLTYSIALTKYDCIDYILRFKTDSASNYNSFSELIQTQVVFAVQVRMGE